MNSSFQTLIKAGISIIENFTHVVLPGNEKFIMQGPFLINSAFISSILNSTFFKEDR